MAVVAESRETLDGLHSYLQRAGIPSSGTRRLGELEALAGDASAMVIFPDELHTVTVSSLVSELLRDRPHLLVILVTGTPHAFQFAQVPARRVIVLPKPAFGWTILDALRDHTTSDRAWSSLGQ